MGFLFFYQRPALLSYVEQVSRLFNCDLHRFKKAGRLYGEYKELRDLIVFLLWERGSDTNREIGEAFSVG